MGYMIHGIEKHLQKITGYKENEAPALQYKAIHEYNRLKTILKEYPASIHSQILDFYHEYNHLVLKTNDEATIKTLKYVKRQLAEASNHFVGMDFSVDGLYHRIRYTQTKGNGYKNRYIKFPIEQPKTLQNTKDFILFHLKCFFMIYLEFERNNAPKRLTYLKKLCSVECINSFTLYKVREFANDEGMSAKKFIRDIFQVEVMDHDWNPL